MPSYCLTMKHFWPIETLYYNVTYIHCNTLAMKLFLGTVSSVHLNVENQICPTSHHIFAVFVLCHSIKWIPNIYELIQVENDEVRYRSFFKFDVYVLFVLQSVLLVDITGVFLECDKWSCSLVEVKACSEHFFANWANLRF